MVQKDFKLEGKYRNGFSVNNLFTLNNVGIVTSRDSFVIGETKEELEERIRNFFLLEKSELQRIYGLKENKKWKINEVKSLRNSYNPDFIKEVSYRPLDKRYIYYDTVFIERSRTDLMQHFIKGENVGLAIGRQGQVIGTENWDIVSITNKIMDFNYYRRGGELVFPLYLYPETNEQQSLEQPLVRTPNLDPQRVEQIATGLGLEILGEE
ncbi:type ISP restriction/modification enzyme [Salegentibacter flavus]|uniref:Type ISP restriction-modification enzyme LLaBIII C-terminal specificity domain-containing protein n=1 Tax=Salegentibacter flavus TaxID=287099 RepID=A0A1I5CH09_9FLAO|nr:type ISP restriction/modification enzyme [Salegentibacter flavus]SFN86300.1 hypothetical protein SAMN05660413_02863 [Salegentibacter flavus]